MEAFEREALQTYEDEMVEHIKQFVPKHSEIIGEPMVRKVVRMGIERANDYDLTTRGPVRFYIELMFILGSDFDTDPQYPWAEEILSDLEITDEMERADRLYEKTINFLKKVEGLEYKYKKEAMHRICIMRFEDLPSSEEDFEREIEECLQIIYPQKFEYIGETAITELVRSGYEVAQDHAVSAISAISLFVILMFILGHGCFNDSQFFWIKETLNNSLIIKSTERFKKLHLRMLKFIEDTFEVEEKR